jgi:D-aminopeptidase
MSFRRVLIIADIEGSSGCWNYAASSFLRKEWVLACQAMTQDVAAVVQALFDVGVTDILVKDFHRTGYNLLAERLDPRARVESGYRVGPVPAMGDPGGAEAVYFLGLHAASGTRGFLAHTMTSRLADVQVNGRPLPEVALFAALLAPYGIRPVFFSGCLDACRQAAAEIPGITTFPIDKTNGPHDFDAVAWRRELARKAVQALSNETPRPVAGKGPFNVRVAFREGEGAARQAARRWGLKQEGQAVRFRVDDLQTLFMVLSRICYLLPALLPILPLALRLQNAKGRLGLAWVRRQLRHTPQHHDGNC